MDLDKLKRDFGFWLSRRIDYPLVPPDTLQISLTSRCNLRCKMCNAWKDARRDDELSLEEVKGVIRQCSEWGIKEVNLCGGEPLISEIIFEVITFAKNSGMRVILTTNGTLINADTADKLVRSGVDIITISVDGARAETHDKIRAQPGAFDKIMQGVRHLNSSPQAKKIIKVFIFTLSNYNLDELEEYFSLARSMSIDALYITSVVFDNVRLYRQDTQDAQGGIWISGERLHKLDEVMDKVEILQRQGYGLNYPSFRLIRKYFRRSIRKGEWVCFAGYRRLALVPGGAVQMCGEEIGNVRKQPSVKKIWYSGTARKRRVNIRKCRNYCLQDCHARQESSGLRNIVKNNFRKGR
jgi:MoaA/NifB/PqqE/SkfB family radical SAM enzyme